MLNWVFYRVLGGVLYRDMFYELIRDWEDHHLTAGWSVRHCQSEKIRSLINVGRDSLANCLHLARLFVLQLIQVACSCIILGRLLSVCKPSNSLSEHTQTHNSVCITIPESMLCDVLPLSHHFYRASIFYTTRKGNHSATLTPTVVGWRCPLPSEIYVQSDPPPSKNADFD